MFQREVIVGEERVAINAGVDQSLPPRAGLGKDQRLVAAVQFVARLRQQARRGGVDALYDTEVDDRVFGVRRVRHQLAHDRLDGGEGQRALKMVEANPVSRAAR